MSIISAFQNEADEFIAVGHFEAGRDEYGLRKVSWLAGRLLDEVMKQVRRTPVSDSK